MTPNAAIGRRPGRWLYLFPALLLVGAGWSASVHGETRLIGRDEYAGSDTDQYGSRRFRLVGPTAIVDTATGITRTVDPIEPSDPSDPDGLSDTGTLAERFAAADPGVSSPPVAVEPTREFSLERPVRLRSVAIGVDAAVIPIGVDASRAIQVPTRVDVAGWWSGGFVPGELGPVVMVGHRDSKDAAGLFAKLGDLAGGDLVEVERTDGATFVYRVDSVERVKKTGFPTERVYGSTSTSTLRLVTCGGSFNRSTGHYVDNVIVYATFVWIKGSEISVPWLAVRPIGWPIPPASTSSLPSTTMSPTSTTTTVPTTTVPTTTVPIATVTTSTIAVAQTTVSPTTSASVPTDQLTPSPTSTASPTPGEPPAETTTPTHDTAAGTTVPLASESAASVQQAM
jgi:hypothetical protein